MKFVKVIKANKSLQEKLNDLKLELRTKEQDLRYNPEDQDTVDSLKDEVLELENYINVKQKAIQNFCNIDILVDLFFRNAVVDNGSGTKIPLQDYISYLSTKYPEEAKLELSNIIQELKQKLFGSK